MSLSSIKTNPTPSPRDNRRTSKMKGFTLIELIITLAVIGMIAAVAVPQTQSIINSYKFNKEVKNVLIALKLARQQAIGRGTTVTVQFNANGYNVFITDLNNDLIPDATITTLKSSTFPENITMSGVFTTTPITFNSRGITQNAGVSQINSGIKSKTISLYITGNSRIL